MDYKLINKFYKEVSYYRKHAELSYAEWQFALRRQFAENHVFHIENIGEHPVFSDFEVTNPEKGNTYKVAIRDFNYEMNY